jgi:hypothetical protein
MSCPICHRGACMRSFHSLEAQERFDLKQTMSDDVDDLRDEILSLQDRIKELESDLQQALSEKEL